MLRIILKRSVLSIEGMEIPIDAKTISTPSDTRMPKRCSGRFVAF